MIFFYLKVLKLAIPWAIWKGLVFFTLMYQFSQFAISNNIVQYSNKIIHSINLKLYFTSTEQGLRNIGKKSKKKR